MQTHEIIMAGTGGQGLVLMATFLAQAAIADGNHVVQTQSYGVAQRGGFISAEVLVSPEEILFQQVRTPSVILALHGVVGARYDGAACPVICDSTLLSRDLPDWHGVPCTAIAGELGVPKAANIVALGALLAVHPVVSLQALEGVIRGKFKGAVGDSNMEAVRRGFAAAGGRAEN
ncbi:MAG: 2-oxoacid:acceptor oxidoreductase family protein [Desulfovibrionaceae bacterium]|jgi:2-oxoglutarate ferredoxin oxidoreductase subunit gamma|nr:2-oxoacid:acceptor oxidoreductase family protein [Desulfovibrionaceae bacterium]